MELLDHIVVRSDVAYWRMPPAWPSALGIGSAVGIMPIAVIGDRSGLSILLAGSLLVLMLVMMT